MSYGLACRCSVGLPGPYAQGGGMASGEGEEKEWGKGEGNLGRGRITTQGERTKGGNSQTEGRGECLPMEPKSCNAQRQTHQENQTRDRMSRMGLTACPRTGGGK